MGQIYPLHWLRHFEFKNEVKRFVIRYLENLRVLIFIPIKSIFKFQSTNLHRYFKLQNSVWRFVMSDLENLRLPIFIDPEEFFSFALLTRTLKNFLAA